MARSVRKSLPTDERKFVADALVALAASILMRYDGPLVEKDMGVARLSGLQAKALLVEYRALKNAGGR